MTENATYAPQFGETDTTFEEPASAQRVNAGSPLDILRKAIEEEVRPDDLILPVPTRRHIKLAYNTAIDGEKFQMWQRRCVVKKGSTDVDVLKLSCIVLANQCKAVLVDHNGTDTEVLGDDGQSLNFTHPDFRNMLLAKRPNGVANSSTQLVRDLFASDGHLLSAAREVIEAAGYGEELDEFEDPTEV